MKVWETSVIVEAEDIDSACLAAGFGVMNYGVKQGLGIALAPTDRYYGNVLEITVREREQPPTVYLVRDGAIQTVAVFADRGAADAYVEKLNAESQVADVEEVTVR